MRWRMHLSSVTAEVDWFFPEPGRLRSSCMRRDLSPSASRLENRHECCHIRKVEPLSRRSKVWAVG